MSSAATVPSGAPVNTAMEMIDRIRDTTESHDRCSVVEVMGRRCGDIALNTGVAVGALTTLVPEIPYDFHRDVLDRIRLAQSTGKRHYIIVVAEGVGNTEELAQRIQRHTGIETRATILGHVQRGGAPTLRDRVVASRMGYHAAELLFNGIGNRVVAMKGEQIVDFDITEALNILSRKKAAVDTRQPFLAPLQITGFRGQKFSGLARLPGTALCIWERR